MRMSRVDRFACLLAVALVAGVWFRADGTSAAFAVTTGNTGDTFSTIADWKPPLVARATVRKAEGGLPGYVRSSGSYTMIVSVADDPTSNPPAGLNSATGDVSSLTTGATALALTASAQTVAGQTYTHATAAQTVTAGHAAGTFNIGVSASDLAVPVNSGTTTFTAVVDNTVPVASSVTITNGGTAGKIDANDTITFAWNEPVDPISIIAGWDGTGSQNVTVQVKNLNNGNGDTVTVWNSANTAQLGLGSVALKTTDYVTASTNIGGPTNPTRSILTWNSTTGAFTVKLGPPDTPANIVATGTAGLMTWSPATTAFDRAGNLSSATTWTQTGTATRKF